MTAIELLQSGQPYRALPILRRAAKKELSIPNLLALGACLRACSQFDEAEEIYMQLMGLTQGRSAEVLNNIAQLLSDRGKFAEAPILFQRALAVAQTYPVGDPAMQQILLGMAYSLLRLGQFEHTWEAFEAGRLGVSWGPLPTTKVWQGEKNARVLIVCEGGFGDGFLFSRWIPKVREISDKVGIVVWNKLLDVCDWKTFGVHEVLPMLGAIDSSKWDYTTSIMSLPGVFKMRSWSDIPPDGMLEAYLETVPSAQRLMAVTQGVSRIGFCFRAEENGAARKIRSLDDVTAHLVAKQLAKTGTVYSLCPAGKSLHRHDKFAVPFAKATVQDEKAMATWHDTANYIRSMDFVLSVDTAVFHLAGLLKVPTLLLLPVRSDWKYGLPSGRVDAKIPPICSHISAVVGCAWCELGSDPDYWYGPHVTYYRETNPEKWTSDAILAAIRSKLRSLEAKD
jgi:hypothetical protein